MNARERTIAAIQHRTTDVVPYQCDLTGQEAQRMAEYTRGELCYALPGSHLVGYAFPAWEEPVPGKPGFVKDAMGVTWNRTGADRDIGVIDTPVLPDPETMDYDFPPLDKARLRRGVEARMAQRGDRFFYAGIGFSMFERAWTLCSMQEVLIGMLAYPERLNHLLDSICEYDLQVLEVLLEYDPDGIYFGDDWGQQKGLIMGPAHWRQFIKPHMAALYSRAKAAGKCVIQHSCGDIREILPDLIDIGLDVYQTVQPEIYDLKLLKREYGKDLTFWGGISTQHILPNGTPQEVRQVTIDTLRIMAPGGGYIAAPTHAVPHDVPPENLLAMMDVFAHQEKYL
ncbi:MAG: uroporphyrinogen decarboxylase family protein [Eubacteriales bacterium]|nr:uroporphyrinogen decarboxylase family protein [Eubacteriales bacterium]